MQNEATKRRLVLGCVLLLVSPRTILARFGPAFSSGWRSQCSRWEYLIVSSCINSFTFQLPIGRVALEHERREQIPEWAALLQVYAALSIPVIFALLFALNLIAWARARINFIFIFELDARTVIDAREYLEVG